MDNALPCYEAAMREARAYLRRRDLSSQDEIPLYFAWQRLYAAANANLSTDFLRETSSELRARQDARLEPRRGIPPPLFTSFDKVNRTSAQASAFLRSGTSSRAAIEMMARRYRRDAEKLRLSREKLVNSIDYTGKSTKKVKRRQKTPQEEVDELLESLEGSERLSDDEDLLAKTAKRGKQQQRRRTSLEDENDDLLDPFTNQQSTKKHAGTMKNKLGAGGYVGGIGVAVNPVKAAELRRSTSAKNPAVAPFGNVANMAAFAAAQVDWRMPPDIDRASSAPELSQRGNGKRLSGANELRKPGLSQKGASLKSTMSGKRLSGGDELREPGPVEGEGDMTLNSSGSSELDEDNFDPNATFIVDAARVSPTGKRNAAQGRSNFSSDQAGPTRDGRGDMARSGRERSMGIQQSQGGKAGQATISEFQQKLVQLSRAVGDMEVKIQGKKLQVTFHGELNDEDGSTRSAEALASFTKSDETKQSSPVKKTFGATGRVSVNDVKQETNVKNAQGRDQARRANTGVAEQKTDVKNSPQRDQTHRENVGDVEQEVKAKGRAQGRDQMNVPRKQSNVRFADTEGSGDYKEDHLMDTTGHNQQQMHVIPSVQVAGQPRQPRSSGHGSALNTNAAAEVLLDGEGDEETKEEDALGGLGQQGEHEYETDSADRFGSHNLRQQMDEEGQQECSDEEIEEGGAIDDEDSQGIRHSVSQRDRRAEIEYQDKSGMQKFRSESGNLQPQTAEERQYNRDGMGEDRSSVGERQARDRRADTEYQDSPTGRNRSGRSGGTQETRQDSFDSRKVQHQMDEMGQGMVGDEDSSAERPDSRHSVSRPDRRAEPAYPDAHTGRNVAAVEKSRPGSRRSHHQIAESDDEGMDETVSQRDHEAEVVFQDARTDRSRSVTQKSSPDSFGSHNLPYQMDQEGQGMNEDRGSIDERQESLHSTSQRDPQTNVNPQDVHTGRSRSVAQQSRPQSRGSERDRMNEQAGRSIEEIDKERNATVDQKARPIRDRLERLQRQPNAAQEVNLSSTERIPQRKVEFERSQRNDSFRERDSSTIERSSQPKVERSQRSDSARGRNLAATERLVQQNVEFDQQSFSDASEDESEGQTSNEQEQNSGGESFVSEDQRSSSRSGSSTRASSVNESVQGDRESFRTPRQSHNQSEDNSVSSDEEFSDGPDTPFKQHKQHHHASSRQSSRVSKTQDEKQEKRRSRSKRSKYPPEFSGNSEISISRDNSSSDEIYRSRSRHSTRNSNQPQSRYPTRKTSRHLPPAMVPHPRRSKDHTKGESKSKKTTWKLPKDIVWPPGMEEECIARLGLDGHHPIAPPGLEHLVTEEQWGEYWTWLHWYSSWQMWYMKNDKKPKKKTDKEKRRRRANSPDNRQNARNSNWWVDASSSKHRHRRERHD
ncbi:hypothetical protein P3T76_009523 [Phytophthora citrophthora]|uniref:Uncharacterized protein n=1 Tax=Phytophthora citrophthora TaxID=4793 RepID=A0AAD9GGS9_9STRA|nr:hypothetical protein P3T76_009523 [Phytophthora citrophthora]